MCHSSAQCQDKGGESCCVCQPGHFGNGRQCLANGERATTPHNPALLAPRPASSEPTLSAAGVPFRVTGKLSGVLNDVNVTALDLQSYVLVQDGRSYTAFSRVPAELGAELQLLTPVAMSIGWMFAKPAAAGAPNGFALTGGKLTHSVEQFFPQSGERLTLTMRYLGLDVFDQIRLEVEVQGATPSLPPGAKIKMQEHEEFFTREVSEQALRRGARPRLRGV